MKASGKYFILEVGDEVWSSHYSRHCGYPPYKVRMFDNDGNPMIFGEKLKIENGTMIRSNGKTYIVEETKKDPQMSRFLLVKVREYYT